jgi:hypothetical protein
MPIYGADFPTMTCQDTFFDPFVEIPQFDEIVVSCAHEFGVIW